MPIFNYPQAEGELFHNYMSRFLDCAIFYVEYFSSRGLTCSKWDLSMVVFDGMTSESWALANSLGDVDELKGFECWDFISNMTSCSWKTVLDIETVAQAFEQHLMEHEQTKVATIEPLLTVVPPKLVFESVTFESPGIVNSDCSSMSNSLPLDFIDKSDMEFIVISSVSDFHANDELFCHALFKYDPCVLNWIDLFTLPESFARLYDMLKRGLFFIYAIIYQITFCSFV